MGWVEWVGLGWIGLNGKGEEWVLGDMRYGLMIMTDSSIKTIYETIKPNLHPKERV